MPVPNRCCCRRVSAIGTNKLLHDHLAEKGTFRVLFTCAHPPSLFSCRSGITQTVGIQVARPKPPRGTSRVTISALRWEEKGFLNFFTCGFSFFAFFCFLLNFASCCVRIYDIFHPCVSQTLLSPPAVSATYLQPSYPPAAFKCRLRFRAWLLCNSKRAQNLKCLWDHESD